MPSTPGTPPPEPDPHAQINASVGDDQEIPLQLDRTPGVGLIGDGAMGAARCLAVSLLVRHTKDQPQVFITWDDAMQLFGPDTNLTGVPGLVVTDDLQDALSMLATEIIHRDRLLEIAETRDFTAYRDTHPDEPLPTILLIARPHSRLTEQAASVLSLGRHRGIIGIIIGSWPAGGTCTVAADGQVTATEGPEIRPLYGTRMFQMAQDEAAIMLATLAAAKGHEPPTAQPQLLRERPEPSEEPRTAPRPVELSILGRIRLRAKGADITKGLRRKGYEVLAYLALHPDGATTETLLGVLWPDAPPENMTNSLYTITSNIRRVLRDATGSGEAEFLLNIDDRYRLDSNLITVDLWQYRTALAAYVRADNDDDRIQALTEAVNIWRGDLSGWPTVEWLEPWRETVRRDAVDTLSRLAELLQTRQPEQALALLEHAITHDKYTEELYRRIMKLQSTLGRRDAIRRTYQLLESRLTEIDAEPDDETASLLQQLLAHTQS
jgi:DNA-binding SARP family transcriptional activator